MKTKFKQFIAAVLNTKVFIFSESKLVYTNATKRMRKIFISAVVFAFFTGYFFGIDTDCLFQKRHNDTINNNYITKYDVMRNNHWKDSIFDDYRAKAELYLSQEHFKGTPIKSEMLSLAARNAYDSTGVFLPVELALSQAQWESDMGRAGRSPITNPYNVGEYDTGTVLFFETTFDGIQAYYYLTCNNYLKHKSLNELLVDFVDYRGYRYASHPSYEQNIKDQYIYIQRWLIKNYVNENEIYLKEI